MPSWIGHKNALSVVFVILVEFALQCKCAIEIQLHLANIFKNELNFDKARIFLLVDLRDFFQV